MLNVQHDQLRQACAIQGVRHRERYPRSLHLDPLHLAADRHHSNESLLTHGLTEKIPPAIPADWRVSHPWLPRRRVRRHLQGSTNHRPTVFGFPKQDAWKRCPVKDPGIE